MDRVKRLSQLSKVLKPGTVMEKTYLLDRELLMGGTVMLDPLPRHPQREGRPVDGDRRWTRCDHRRLYESREESGST